MLRHNSVRLSHVETGQTLTVVNPKFTQFYAGGYESKQLLAGNVDGMAASYVVRGCGSMGMRNSYLASWRMLRDAKQPVVPDVYYIFDGHVAVPDVKADGSEVYGRNLYRCYTRSAYASVHFRRRPERDADFLRLTSPVGLAGIREELDEHIQNANARDICFPADDPFDFRVSPDGEGRVLSLDIHDAYPASKYFTTKNNTLLAVGFIGILKALRSVIKPIGNESLCQ